MANNNKENERAELHKTIWRIANDLRGSVDGWDFKAYVLGTLFYRFISENLTGYLNEQERKAGSPGFDYLKAKGSGQDKEIRATIERAINASPSLRNKKDLIEQFVDSVSPKAKVDAQWQAFVAKRKVEDLDRIIADEGLNADETKAFVDNAFRDGAIPVTGTAITKILPPVSRFARNNGHSAKKQSVLDKLDAFFERYFGLA